MQMAMDSPYATPSQTTIDPAGIARSKRFWGRSAWIFGLAAVIPPIPGLVWTVRGLTSTFVELNKSGSADPTALAGEIASSLLVTLLGLGVSILILIPFSVSLFQFLKNRKLLRAASQPDLANLPPTKHP